MHQEVNIRRGGTCGATPNCGSTPISRCHHHEAEETVYHHHCETGERCREIPLQANSLAMVFSPHQCFRNLYEPAEALLRRGTLFRELYKPFQPNGRTL